MPDINSLLALLGNSANVVKRQVNSLLKPSDVMSPQDRAGYIQSTGEDIQGNRVYPQPVPMQAAYQDPPQQTVDPEAERRYLEMRRAQRASRGM